MDTLSSLMEVKLDIRERRSEWLPLRSWTRCYVKIEAIKCFPCYMKISFHKNAKDIDNGLVLRINIPGLEIYPVKSRTKEFAYGLYWKQNRKNCIAFLSFDSKLSMDAHMRWFECQVQNLETYRKEILQSSRFSRATMEQSLIEDSEMYQNMNDILGPLPKIPSEREMSQRMSVVSGIYEEIVEPAQRNVQSSAIYEEMRLNPSLSSSPPPLPPRTRKNTDCSSLQRSYTTPESEMVKKKWNLFENVFGKSKTKRRERQTPQPRDLQLLKAKRNSFSSPDLSHLDGSLNNCADCSFESNISSSNSWELENLCEAEENVDNISHQIKPNFELKLDSDVSSVNLVGSNYHLSRESPAKSPPGYLEMRPGRGFDMKKVEELDAQIKNDVLYRLKYSFDSPITYKREFDMSQLPPVGEGFYTNDRTKKVESHYVCMTMGKRVNEEPTYTPMIRVTTRESSQESSKESPESTKVKCKRHSVDEKIASYYPNYDVPAKCLQEVAVRNNFKIPLQTSSAIDIPLTRKGGKRVGSFNFRSDNNKTSESPKKYATLSRITVTEDHHHLSPAAIKKSGSISPTSIKRFASLPRFKKIDFSPLRMKISSVLQRGNAGGC